MKKKIINKGYTITVDSWENDGDNSRTKSLTVEDKELAKTIVHMCKNLFISENNKGKGIGNANEGEDDKVKRKVIPYMKANPILYEDVEVEDDDHLYDICLDWAYQLMGGSEYYICRVMEDCTVTYSPEDIFLEEVKF